MIQRETLVSAHLRANGPVRTCVGCRKRELAVGLFRVVAVPTENGSCAVIVDAAGNLPGRGAWLHPVLECTTQAIRRRAWAKALRVTGSPDTSAVVEHISLLAGSSAPATGQVAKNMSTP